MFYSYSFFCLEMSQAPKGVLAGLSFFAPSATWMIYEICDTLVHIPYTYLKSLHLIGKEAC